MDNKNFKKKATKLGDKVLTLVARVFLLALSASQLYELVNAPESVRSGIVVVFTIMLAVTAFKR